MTNENPVPLDKPALDFLTLQLAHKQITPREMNGVQIGTLTQELHGEYESYLNLGFTHVITETLTLGTDSAGTEFFLTTVYFGHPENITQRDNMTTTTGTLALTNDRYILRRHPGVERVGNRTDIHSKLPSEIIPPGTRFETSISGGRAATCRIIPSSI